MFKKLFILILVVITATVALSACNRNNDDMYDNAAENKAVQAIDILAGFDINDCHGYDYSVKQYNAYMHVVNSDFTLCLIERSERTTAFINTVSERLNEFSDDFQSTVEITRYYHNNQIGVQLNDGAIAWKNGTESEFFGMDFSVYNIDITKLVFYSISDTPSLYTICINIPKSLAKEIFGVDRVNNAALTLTVNLEENRLIDFEFSYALNETTNAIVFKPIYQPQTVILPQQ